MTFWRPTLGAAEPVYLALVSAIERDLAEGRLQTGEKLPPQRKLARALGISLGTVTRAYAEAERRGLVYGEVGRGTFAGRRPAEDRFGGGTTGGTDLALTWPLYGLDPDLGAALRELSLRADLHRFLEYGPNVGHRRHRSAGRQWAEHQGITVEEDRIVVCVGAQHAMTVVLGTVCQPGDCLLAEPVTYPGLKALAAAQHLRLVGVPMDEEGMLPDAFRSLCESRRPRALYTIPTIQNPTAAVLGEDRKDEIAAIAREHGVAIIEDEVHRLLHPDPPPAFATIAPDITYTILSLSKVVAGGLRVAFLVTPPGRAERVGHLLWATTWMAPPLMAEVGARWIEDGTAAATALRKRQEAAARQAIAAEELGRDSYRSAPNAYHVWLPLPRGWSAADFTLECERRGVAVSSAATFAVSREHAGDAVRLSLTGPASRDDLRRGLRTVAGVLHAELPATPVI
ncbi:MAG TPA: PLP-dependent aminotransferase family protein [Longimicrobiales bacterium]